MSTNPNIENKRTVEIYDWRDFRGDYNPWQKKYYRKLRRKKLKRFIKKEIEKEIK